MHFLNISKTCDFKTRQLFISYVILFSDNDLDFDFSCIDVIQFFS